MPELPSAESNSALQPLPLHGGDIQSAAQQFNRPVDQWIDLSTGMNPEPYPIPAIPVKFFNDLPYSSNSLLAAAKKYYRTEALLPVAGSQAAIQLLPQVLSRLPVLLPDIGYQEHQHQWQASGVEVAHYGAMDTVTIRTQIDRQIALNPNQHLVVIRPNNPTTALVSCEYLLASAAKLGPSAYMIVDEAFIDTTPECSLLNACKLPSNVIVLRSFGKFFGLAGIRIGFICAVPALLEVLENRAGVWAVNGPAQYIAAQALNDQVWQEQALQRVKDNAALTRGLFQPLIQKLSLTELGSTRLFLSYRMPLSIAENLYYGFAKNGVLMRLVILADNNALLRIGCISLKNKRAQRIITTLVEGFLRGCEW